MQIDDLLPRLLPDVPGCPDATARNAIIDAAIDLCRETRAWNEIQDPTTLIDMQHTYDVDPPKGARVVAVTAMSGANGEILPKTMAEIQRLLPNWQSAVGSMPLWFNSAPGANVVRVFPTPKDAKRARITMRVAYQPTLTATELPDLLIDAAHEMLLDGAKGRLFAMRNKPWTDLMLAAAHAASFQIGKSNLRIDVLHENVPATLHVAPRAFGF